jgi:hypothetical protein
MNDIFFFVKLCSLVASMSANVSTPKSRGLGHYGGHGTTAAAMVFQQCLFRVKRMNSYVDQLVRGAWLKLRKALWYGLISYF